MQIYTLRLWLNPFYSRNDTSTGLFLSSPITRLSPGPHGAPAPLSGLLGAPTSPPPTTPRPLQPAPASASYSAGHYKGMRIDRARKSVFVYGLVIFAC